VLEQLSARLLHADPESCGRIGIERHRFAVFDSVLSHPAAMRLPDLDMDSWILLTPSPDGLLRPAKSLQVVRVCSVLTDFESTIDLHQGFGQRGMPIEEESIGDQHQIRVGPTFTGEMQMIDQLWIQQRLAAEQCESLGQDSLVPRFILTSCGSRRRHRAGQTEVAVMAALLASQVASVREMVLQCGNLNHRQITLSSPCFSSPAFRN